MPTAKNAKNTKNTKPAIVPAGFDPDAAATGDGLFGLDTRPEDARIVVIPVPFDTTTSYRAGTASGPPRSGVSGAWRGSMPMFSRPPASSLLPAEPNR